LIDEDFCKEMLRVKNFIPSISLEGFKEANDSRRGQGVYDKVMNAMAMLKEHKLPFVDKAAMIASAAYYEYLKGHESDMRLNAIPSLKLGER
jgi:sulfatase maturation enzyme AslB (radical SAM superfamily)